MNIIQFPRPTGITQGAINLLHEVAVCWSKSEPAPLTVAFGLTDEQEAWCVFSDGLTDEPRYSFWEQDCRTYYMDHRVACQCGDVHPTTARSLKKLIVRINDGTKRKANE